MTKVSTKEHLRLETRSYFMTKSSKKLEFQWVGPYTITEKISNVNYVIKGGRKTIRVHASRIKPLKIKQSSRQ